ncbi:MAG: IS200/IS605 family transposase, partial [Candidatus Latescibacteria bacterium]|nr:IS200/IS605 family transposase [Candidatus Latescibacterota bacterium]
MRLTFEEGTLLLRDFGAGDPVPPPFVWDARVDHWRVRDLLYRVVEDFDFVIEALEVAKDHVHLFLSFPPRYSISKVVGMLKSISASRVFQEHP